MIQDIEKTRWRALIPLLAVICLLLVAKPGPTARASLLQGQPDDPLPFGKTIEREMSRGAKHRYSFTLEAGQFVQVVVEQKGVDVIVTIFGQDGKLLAEVDRPNSMQGLETASLIAPGSGGYHLQIRAQRTTSIPGGYQITLKEPRAAISSDEKRIAAEKMVTEAVRLWMKNTADALRQSVEKYERAHSLWSEIGEPYEEALALYGAGLSYRSLGENQAAILVFKRALDLMRNAGNRLGIAIVQAGVGWSYLRLGELDQALESFRQSLELRQGGSNPAGEGLTYYGIGWVYLLRKEDQSALENFERSLGLRQAANDPRGEAYTRIGMGKIYSRQERYDESRAMLEPALRALRELDDKGGQADALSHLGWIGIRLKQDAAAKAHFQAEFDLSQASGDRTAEADARFGLAVLARREDSLLEALDHIERVVGILESLRTQGADSVRMEGDNHRLRIAYFARVQEYYEVYIDLLMRLDEREPGAGHAAEALHVSERARARGLLDLLARAGGRDSEPGHAQPLRVDGIQRWLLDEKTVLLEYALGDERNFLWMVTQTGVESHLLPKRAEIEAAAQRIYKLVTVRNHSRGPRRRETVAQSDAQFQVAARELSRMLLAPVATKLTGKRLLIVPQGVLQFVPFAALPVPETGRRGDGETRRRGDGETGRRGDGATGRRREGATGRLGDGEMERNSDADSLHRPVAPSPRRPVSYTPLIAEHEVVVAPSASSLAAIRRQTATRPPAERGLIVFADPVFSAADDRVRQLARQRSTPPQEGEPPFGAVAGANAVILPNLNRLSATAWEAQRIASLAGDSRVVRDFAANLDVATDPTLGKYRFIHFATHAVINPRNFDLSAIVLSQVNEQGRPRNGLLSAQDVRHLRFPAELVVLSACHTGLGKDARGEGLLSLTRGFLSAGAARVLVSLWAVEDQATAEMMSRFYRRMLGPERMTPAAALRATQEEMWREGRWGAPYYWGGFVLQGDWR